MSKTHEDLKFSAGPTDEFDKRERVVVLASCLLKSLVSGRCGTANRPEDSVAKCLALAAEFYKQADELKEGGIENSSD